MSHLTMGELATGGILPDPHADAVAKIRALRQLPGYGETMLRRYWDVIPSSALTTEILRLRQAQDAAMRNDPAATAWTALNRAYVDNDVTAIQAWEASVNNAGARRLLDYEKARLQDQATRIFGMRRPLANPPTPRPGSLLGGMSGMGCCGDRGRGMHGLG